MISKIGARSFKVRLVYTIIFAVLILGAVTMIYPFMLMISGSLKSDTDFVWVTPIPRYFSDDDILWMKYVESKYGTVGEGGAEVSYRRLIGTFRKITPPQNTNDDLVEAFGDFREHYDWPKEWFTLGHVQYTAILAKNGRLYRRFCTDKFDGDIKAFSDAIGVRYNTWSQIGPPTMQPMSRRFTFPTETNYEIFYRFKADAPKADWIPVDLDGDFQVTYLRAEWGTIEAYNKAHGSDHSTYAQVVLSARAPKDAQSRKDWEEHVRLALNLFFIRIDASATEAFQNFLRKRYTENLPELNKYWSTSFQDFAKITIPAGLPKATRTQTDLSAFIKDREACPAEALSVYGPRQAFEQYVADKRGVPVERVTPLLLPTEGVDYADFKKIKSELRWEFAKRNYLAVFDYLLLHGNGIKNTVIYCTLLVAISLLVNPLAAYALSRYKPPSAYKILLFCMCTMAFPGEVTMIPSFLLLKRFPLYYLIVFFVVMFVSLYVLNRTASRWSAAVRGALAVGIGGVAGYWVTPLICQLILGQSHGNVSLLNTFFALILPRMANGYSIFLLKGFFDSLPRELYEAADLDGASEWTKFWLITMTLSKPILAVMALSAFTAAYGEFMMALVIIPDQSMWTIMVWLFQLQNESHPTVVYASLIIAAIPTFLIFLFCQNLIMRGIVVPTEK